MISRKAIRLLSEIYHEKFTMRKQDHWGYSVTEFFSTAMYDYMFDRDYPAWLCNKIRAIPSSDRCVKDFIMRMGTGEIIAGAYSNKLPLEKAEKIGQSYIRQLAEDIFQYEEGLSPSDTWSRNELKEIPKLKRQLELDGYLYKEGVLLISDDDVIDTEYEEGVLESLIRAISLDHQDIGKHHLIKSASHYLEGNWDDSIANSRKLLEWTLQESAAKHHLAAKGTSISSGLLKNPRQVRDYLESGDILENKEREAIAKIYGLLSETGGHPYIAKQDQARLMRHLALTFSQFVLLRIQGFLGSNQTGASMTEQSLH